GSQRRSGKTPGPPDTATPPRPPPAHPTARQGRAATSATPSPAAAAAATSPSTGPPHHATLAPSSQGPRPLPDFPHRAIRRMLSNGRPRRRTRQRLHCHRLSNLLQLVPVAAHHVLRRTAPAGPIRQPVFVVPGDG